ncbi:zinc-ribbon and FHA domain-containing protein [Catenulispora sp. NF23]|uniref:Zinc-ribbon and FHA domain-containing protein n=1 Tax=Catenulispora pinistramenti TaxID=2705254 RepID=A0ABS5KYT2_9ACTN|nr:FHA domain-containing protein [Catenulispora pinistramenti]MBS2538710.1 zinc-ribbon and FHA domain-containing protein [Catenulispora pinistramenti]MBS2551223.1 zinc-ribbon and FHA domain-containing protein [Catenulispora pinistramenti]
MPFCTRCGNANQAGSRFCSHCGTALAESPLPGDPLVPEGAAERTSTMSLVSVEAAAEAATGVVGEETEQVGLGPADREALAALPAGSALLVVRRGPNAGSRFLLDADVTTVGRSPDSDIFLDDVTVSRRHAEFARTAQGFLVRDVGSLNGTYVDRNLIQEALLRDGDEVQVGKYRLVFHAG